LHSSVAIGVSVPIYEGGALRNRTEAVRIDTAPATTAPPIN